MFKISIAVFVLTALLARYGPSTALTEFAAMIAGLSFVVTVVFACPRLYRRYRKRLARISASYMKRKDR